MITITGGKLTIFRRWQKTLRKRRLPLASTHTLNRYYEAPRQTPPNIPIYAPTKLFTFPVVTASSPELLVPTGDPVQGLPPFAEKCAMPWREAVGSGYLLCVGRAWACFYPTGRALNCPPAGHHPQAWLGRLRWEAEVSRYTKIYTQFHAPRKLENLEDNMAKKKVLGQTGMKGNPARHLPVFGQMGDPAGILSNSGLVRLIMDNSSSRCGFKQPAQPFIGHGDRQRPLSYASRTPGVFPRPLRG